MREDQKTKAELLQEVETLRRRVAELEQSEDITERKKAEETLEAERGRLYSLLDGLPAFVYLQAPDHSVRFANRYFREHFGESEGKQCYEVLWGAKEPCKPCLTFKVFETNKPQVWEWSQSPDGRIYEINDYPFSDVDGSPLVLELGIDITERKRMEDTLWESEKRFREIFENIAVGVYRTAPDGQILMANPALVHMLGYSSFEELSQRNLEEEGFELPYERSMFIEEIEREGRIVGSESTWITRDGKKLHVIENARAVRDEDGKTLYYEGTAENITERKNTGQSLRESEERLRVALSAAQMGTWRWHPATNQDTRDASFNGILGLEAVESTQPVEDFLQRVHPEDRDMVDAEIQRSLREHCTYVAEFRIVCPDGTVRWLRDQGKPIYDENDHILYLTGAVVDITERKRAEDALRESEKKYKALFQGAAEGIVVADTETKDFKYVNPAICKMLGYTENELEQMGIRDIHPKEDLEYIISEFEAQARGEKTLSSNIPCLRKDGTIMYANINTAMVLMDGRQYNVGFFTDITEVKRAEMELNEYREKMARAERLASVGTLSAIMTHTLNDLLTVIQLSIQGAMEESKKTPRQSTITKYLKKGLRSVSEVSSTVQRLGKFASESSKEIISEVNLKAVAERTVKLLSESARQTKMSLHLEGMGELPPIYSNERGLEQLFFSLAENAIQAADGKKSHQLIISGVVKDEEIELRFTDNCGGITQENLDKIFELFFTTKPADERTGLGLCIVDRIVSEADGNIRVESKAGKGSTFFVTLPTSRGTRY